MSLPNVIGFDIGGANTKAAFISVEKGHLIDLTSSSRYFPVWKERERLSSVLLRLESELSGSSKV